MIMQLFKFSLLVILCRLTDFSSFVINNFKYVYY